MQSEVVVLVILITCGSPNWGTQETGLFKQKRFAQPARLKQSVSNMVLTQSHTVFGVASLYAMEYQIEKEEGSQMQIRQNWVCKICKQILTTFIPLRETPKCSNKHKPTDMEKTK
jgi:hypothetical protein